MQAQVPRRFPPRDDSGRDPAFSKFRAALLTAAARGDVVAIRSATADTMRLPEEVTLSANEFLKQGVQQGQPWKAMQEALELGAAATSETVGGCLVASAFAQDASHRTIEYAPSMSIAERLLPADQEVLVHRPYDYPVFDREPQPRDVLDDLLGGQYGTAVLMDVRSVRGVLVENGCWIETVFEGSVVETLSTAAIDGRTISPLVKGGILTASLDGGTVTIGKVRVRTTDSVSFPQNQRYLVFLGLYPDPDTGHVRLGSDPLMVRNNGLLAVPGSKTKLTGLTLDDVKRLARSNKK